MNYDHILQFQLNSEHTALYILGRPRLIGVRINDNYEREEGQSQPPWDKKLRKHTKKSKPDYCYRSTVYELLQDITTLFRLYHQPLEGCWAHLGRVLSVRLTT